jgi:hypothetical protein
VASRRECPAHALVVQWIEFKFAVLAMQVRFLPRAQQENTPKGVFSVVPDRKPTVWLSCRNRIGVEESPVYVFIKRDEVTESEAVPAEGTIDKTIIV